MRTVFRFLLMVVGSGALALGITTAVDALRTPAAPLGFADGGLTLREPLRQGAEYDVPVEVRNASDEPARLIGSLDYCGGACYQVRGLPIAVPPRGRGRVTLHIAARVPGPLEEEVLFYTDRPTQPQLTLRVRATIREADHEPTHPATTAAR